MPETRGTPPKPNWAVRSIDRAAADPRRRALLTPLGPLLMGSVLLALVHLASRADRFLGMPQLPGNPARLLLGIPLVAAGVLLAGSSARRFFRARGTPVPFNPPKDLVVAGPYRRTRNPMMTGLLVAMLGVAFLRRSTALAVVFVPLLTLLMYLVIKFVEEPELEQRFGDAYRRYRDATPRFVPRLRAGRSQPR